MYQYPSLYKKHTTVYNHTMKYFIALALTLLILTIFLQTRETSNKNPTTEAHEISTQYWLLLHRTSNIEFLYQGTPGNTKRSTLLKTFKVKTGIPGQKPTPLPTLLGRDYWTIVKKFEVKDNPELAPYFLTLDVPYTDIFPFGPEPYLECNGQCDWEIPGSFGLHGINGDFSKLSETNLGSSGCIRHRDEDITYLYNLLKTEHLPVRYYIDTI